MKQTNKGKATKAPQVSNPIVMTEDLQKKIDAVNKHPEMIDIHNILNHSYDDINDAYASDIGLDAWFNAYLQSDTFTSLSRDKRAEAFSLYRAIYTFFECIENVCERHNVGVYKQD